MSRSSRVRNSTPADGSLRKSQVITTFGPGAMVDLVDQAVLIGGLDFWSYGHDERQGTRVIAEPRLRDALQQKFGESDGRILNVARPFREPPTCNDQSASPSAGIQVLEFPSWFVCQACRALLRARDNLELKGGRYMHACDGGRKLQLATPVRFVGACPSGHLQDWPWVRFVHDHGQEGHCSAPDLVLVEGSRGEFSEIVVRCRSCQAERKLISAMVPQTRYDCGGHRPWLGPQEQGPCDEKLRLMVRTASNSYFSQVVSALSIPDPSSALSNAVKEVWDTVKVATADLLPAFRQIPAVEQALREWSDKEVLEEIEICKSGRQPTTPPLRTAEYVQFMGQKMFQPGDAPKPEDQFFARRINPSPHHKQDPWPKLIERVVIAPKLREVRAQVGFTRIDSMTANLEGEYELEELKIQLAQLGSESVDWLPAIEILGEGVWINLDEAKVSAWEQRPAVQARAKALYEGYQSWAKDHQSELPFPGVRFYMLHSLSHLLLTAITLECGYAASSVRERLYCAPSNAEVPMAAILISTGTPGAEGTLGGLVDQAQHLPTHLRRAFDLATLCSGDPVCSHHDPSEANTSRYLEGAACHACLFLAECSCERFNHFLDRALVVPCFGQPSELAFFSERP